MSCYMKRNSYKLGLETDLTLFQIDFKMLDSANPEVIDRCTLKQQTPLFLAVVVDNMICVQSLLERGANPNIADKDKETPLYKGKVGIEHDTFDIED